MAYTLTDRLRPLRVALRINGTFVGLVPGLALLLLPKSTLLTWGLFQGGAAWPVRLAGAALFGLGVLFVWMAGRESMGIPLLVTVTLVNTLFAFVLLIAYFQQEFAHLNGVGRVLLVL